MQTLGPPLLAAVLWLAPSPTRADDGAHAPVGEAKLPSGLVAHYEYHFDRNALLASERAGDALIALTRSGNLLRFDAKSLKLTREWFGPVPATCLGRGEADAVLVGFEDGRVARVDPASLTLVEVARLAGGVRWVGWSPGGLVAVAEPTVLKEWNDGVRRPTRFSVVHNLASGKSLKITSTYRDPKSGKEAAYDRRASAFFLDGKRRLWLGADHGEWGGWCVRVDLDAGRVVEVAGIKDDPDQAGEGWDGVYGFAELPDGQVWAHGGTMHMGFTRGFLRRVDGPKVEPLYLYGNYQARKGHEDDEKIPEPKQPYLPITHILPGGNGKLLAFAYSNIYRVDPGLKAWSRNHALQIRYRPGRPDAVGTYPSLVTIHRIGDRLLCATSIDGYVSVADGKGVSHALPGQLGIDHAWRIAGSAEGTLFLPWDDREPTWRLGVRRWEVVDLAPPCELAPDDAFINSEKPSWAETHVLIGQDGTVRTASATNWGSGTRTTARRIRGKSEVLGREMSDLYVTDSFITPDSTLWNASFGDLKRFADGRWQSVAPLPGVGPLGEGGFRTGDTNFPVGRGLQAVGDAGPPWLLLDRDKTQLLRLDHGPGFKDPKLDAVKVVEAGAARKVHDAIVWSKGELLLATDKGLRRFDIASSEVRPSTLPDPGRAVTSLARDGLGRTCLAGEGLWLVDPDGKRLHDCGGLPMLGRTPVAALAADPGHRDGIIASLGTRGAVFVRVPPGS